MENELARISGTNSSHQCRMCRGGAGCLERKQVQSSARCHERARSQQNAIFGRMPIPRQHAAHVLEERRGPTTKQFDDDEWIASLTEAQETTADVPEDTCMTSKRRPEKSSTHSNGRILAEVCLAAAPRRVKSHYSRQRCGSSELAPEAVPRLSPSFISSTTVSGPRIPGRAACKNQSRRKELLRNDSVGSSARSGVPVSSKAHCGGGVETSAHVSR